MRYADSIIERWATAAATRRAWRLTKEVMSLQLVLILFLLLALAHVGVVMGFVECRICLLLARGCQINDAEGRSFASEVIVDVEPGQNIGEEASQRAFL